MEDKTFELLTRLYGEFSEFKQDMSSFKQDMNSFKQDMNSFKQDMNIFRRETKNDIIRLENKLDNNSKALFDGYRQTYEEVKELKKAVNDISSKLEKQELEIKVIKGGR